MAGPTSVEWVIELRGWRDRRGRFARADDQLRDRTRDALAAVGVDAVKAAREQTPKGKPRPGHKHMADSWAFDVHDTPSGADGALTNADEHADAVIYGSAPHLIVPRTAGGVLRFETDDGEVVFTRSVHHPGTEPNDIPGRVAESLRAPAERELRRAANRVADFLAH